MSEKEEEEEIVDFHRKSGKKKARPSTSRWLGSPISITESPTSCIELIAGEETAQLRRKKTEKPRPKKSSIVDRAQPSRNHPEIGATFQGPCAPSCWPFFVGDGLCSMSFTSPSGDVKAFSSWLARGRPLPSILHTSAAVVLSQDGGDRL